MLDNEENTTEGTVFDTEGNTTVRDVLDTEENTAVRTVFDTGGNQVRDGVRHRDRTDRGPHD